MVRLAVLLALVAAGPTPSSGARAPDVPTPIAVTRDIHLSVPHGLGIAEAKRRTAARFAAMQAQFAGSVAASRIDWTGDGADIRARALGQTATARVLVGETKLDIDVHLPVLLAPLRGRVETYLTRTAVETLTP